MEHLQNYINGELTDPLSGMWLPNFEPATGALYSRIPASTAADIDTAAEAAARAFPGWSATPAEERSRMLLRIT